MKKPGWKNDPIARVLHELKLYFRHARLASAREAAYQHEALDDFAAQLLQLAAKDHPRERTH